MNDLFLNSIRSFFSTYAPDARGESIAVGLSGGADSVSLICALNELSDELGISVFAMHFNHGIRGNEADRDEAFCRKLCEALNVPFYSKKEDVPAFASETGMSLEEAARERRYAFFRSVLSDNGIAFCATAHTMDDNAETLIFNIARGSASNGGAGIAPRRGNILRPMLGLRRCEVEAYLSSIKRDFVVDSTNLCDDYTRNYIRHTVIPSLEKINPQAVRAISRFTASARNDAEYFDSVIGSFSDDDLNLLQPSISDRVIIRKYREFTGRMPDSDLMARLKKALAAEKRIVTPVCAGCEAVTENGRIAFLSQREINAEGAETVLHDGRNSLFSGETDLYFCVNAGEYESFNKIATTALLSFDNIVGVPIARKRCPGDRIRILGVNRSVKKLFIEKKIPSELRDIIPVICDGEGILYIPFIGTADRAFANGKNTKKLVTVLNRVEKERWHFADETEK